MSRVAAVGRESFGGGAPSTAREAVSVVGVRRVYGSTVALAGADLRVMRGEIHGLLGENGAGKSTLVRLLAGLEAADDGTIEVLGEHVRPGGSVPGSAFIHQDLGLYQTLSVAENIALEAGYERKFGLVSNRRTIRRAQDVLDRLGINLSARATVGELPLASQTAVALARAMARGVEVIVLDEPTAYLEAEQVRSLFGLLRSLRSQDVACILITHRADDVLKSCDRLTVLRNGRTVESRTTDGLDERTLVNLISGEGSYRAPQRRSKVAHDVVMAVDGLAGSGFHGASLSVSRGEIVGLTGLGDAGHFELGRALFGLGEIADGRFSVAGTRRAFKEPADAVAAGVAYVPSDRKQDGLAATLLARENLFMRTSSLLVRRRSECASALELMTRFGVVPADPDYEMGAFSGGNQQKILLAKWLAGNPRVLILNDPTAGVDLAAKMEIHRQLAAAAEGGVAMLVISSDFAEVAELCHRVYVMRHGRIVADVGGPEAEVHRLISLAYGGDGK